MKYTAPQGILSSPIFLIEPAPVTSLWYFLHTIPDHRRAQGKRHNLPTVLILAILAICSGATSYQAISEWTVNYQEHLRESVLFQMGTDIKGKEIKIAPQVLDRVYVKDRIITADALHAQKNFCETITKRGGGYVMVVKGNQETLQEDIRLFFENLPFKTRLESFQTLEKNKGRVEKRAIWMSKDQSLIKYLSWPGLTHVFKVQRDRSDKGQKSTETVYGIASLPKAYSGIMDLSKYLRGHWSIENNLHRVRDVSFSEDKSTIRKGHAPEVMAGLRNLVISIFQRGNVKSYPQAFRRFSAHPKELFTFLGLNQQVQPRIIYA